MELKPGGTIVVDGCSVLRTAGDRWYVSRNGTMVGEVDTLDEVEGLITRRKEEVRARLVRLGAEAARKAEAEATDLSMRLGEGMGIDPNHNPIVGFMPDGTPYDM